MPDKKPEFAPLIFTDPNNVGVDFISMVATSGQHNAVVNLTLATARYMPKPDGSVDNDFIISHRLRMDIGCAMQLRAELDRCIKQVEAVAKQGLATAMVTTAAPGPSGKAS